jgi:cell wall-associated NlpC family hydrolase
MAVAVVSPVVLAAVVALPQGQRGAPSSLALEEIPQHLLPIYRAAAVTCPGLPWQVLAAIGFVESRHGRGDVDPVTGDVDPPIVGPALDGQGGVALVPDASQPDGYARASGPMQFLSATWERWATLAPDRPPGAVANVHNAWDAIFTAARYLCGNRGQLGDVGEAVLSYNHSSAYVRHVLAKADAYGRDEVGDAVTLVNESGDRVVAAAMTQLGVPYVWGGSSPTTGFDCSGLVQWAYARIGIALPRTTSEQVLVGIPVDPARLRPGDLVFSRSVRGGRVVELGHVAIYAGGGQVVLAPRTGDVVSLRAIMWSEVQLARRVTR